KYQEPINYPISPYHIRLAQVLIEKRQWLATILFRDNSRRAVVRRVTEQAAVILKIAWAEGLQRMFDYELVDRYVKIFRNVIEQFARQYARRKGLVVAQ